MEQVFSDTERIELCKALKEIIDKRSFVLDRNDLPWNDKMMQKEKLSHVSARNVTKWHLN